ncbi:MAG: glutamate-5-semialdehyde dehydrogenase [Actinomycetota bacterium]|nr:glutamate-5-semialdehyde dehydrogenase [Actinomycetota bacterium]
MVNNVEDIARNAKKAAAILGTAAPPRKDAALMAMAWLLESDRKAVVEANRRDLEGARKAGLEKRMVDRLIFDDARVDSRIKALHAIASLEEPTGDIQKLRRMPSGLMVGRMRVPIGVIGMVYESRPHVTVNAGALCVKSGNAAVLRGGSEVINTNRYLGKLWKEALEEAGLPGECVQVIPVTDRAAVREMLRLDRFIDLVIPRGGEGLINTVVELSRIPVIKHLHGICHVYVDGGADQDMAMRVCLDSKIFAPEVCNAAETFLVSEGVAESLLPELARELEDHGVEIRGCERTRDLVEGALTVMEEDWSTEYLDLVVSVKVVKDVEEAMAHINRYGSGHTESIVSDSAESIVRFLAGVDSGVLLVNASTMYCDGSELGMGAEIGISTDKIHARGPMGIEDLTTYKTLVFGQGHCMG